MDDNDREEQRNKLCYFINKKSQHCKNYHTAGSLYCKRHNYLIKNDYKSYSQILSNTDFTIQNHNAEENKQPMITQPP